jgi:uncharacterized alkaline shock family protein YloU
MAEARTAGHSPGTVKSYAFVGAAGTGKSQRAQLVADYLDADYIIDDGLVIRRTEIVCGKSAKAERNQISAIRRALFEYDDHMASVKNFFAQASPCSVMVIATSEDMARRIIGKLGFAPPSRIVRIEEVATPEEISRAIKERRKKGQHVIPVSHVLVRKNFAGKMVGRLRVLWRSKSPYDGEKTIVRPPFSFYGDVHIEPEAIGQLASYIASRIPQVASGPVSKVHSTENDSLSIEIEMRITPGPKGIPQIAETVRRRTAQSVGYFSGLDVCNVDVSVTGVEF